MKNLEEILENRIKLYEKSPLIHAITNPIAITMCANAILSLGAKAICAEHPLEMEDIVSISSSLSVNLGNITKDRMDAMSLASHIAKKKGISLAIDLVGVGASKLRYDFAKNLLEENKFDLIKGNSSEIKAIADIKSNAVGIDVGDSDIITQKTSDQIINIGKDLAKKYQSTIFITGKRDILVSTDETYIIDNGCESLAKITGTGCMLTAMISSFMAVTDPIKASLLAALILEISAELANSKKLATFFTDLMDNIATIDDKTLIKKAKVQRI